MKKIFLFSIILCVAMAATLSASGQDDQGSAMPDVLSFSLYQPQMGTINMWDTFVGKEWVKAMEEYLGVTLDIENREIPWRGGYLDKRDIYLASGDFADVMLVLPTSDEYQIFEIGDAGLVVDLYDYKKYTPYYDKLLDQNFGRLRGESPEGKMYAFWIGGFGTGEGTGGTQQYWSYRKDTFDDLGIAFPEDLNDVYEAAKKIKSAYPSSYPVGGYGGTGFGMNYTTGLFQLNKTRQTVYFNGDKFVFGPVDDKERFKATLEYLNKMYEDGLMDPEWLSNTRDQHRAKMVNGTSHMSLMLYLWEVNDANKNSEFNGQWVVPKLPKNLYGETGYKFNSGAPIDGGIGTFAGTTISTKAEHPELLAKMIDYQYSDEMMTLITWGIEGETFSYNSDGKAVFTEDIASITDPDENQAKLQSLGLWTGSTRGGIHFASTNHHIGVLVDDSISPSWDGKTVVQESYGTFTGRINDGFNSAFPEDEGYVPPIRVSTEDKETIANIMTPIETYLTESIAKFIVGDMPISDYDKFLTELDRYGDWKTVVDIKNAALAVAKQKMGM